jgi:hypothetical protein
MWTEKSGLERTIFWDGWSITLNISLILLGLYHYTSPLVRLEDMVEQLS